MTPLAASISDATIWSVTFDETRSVDYDRNSFIIQATDFIEMFCYKKVLKNDSYPAYFHIIFEVPVTLSAFLPFDPKPLITVTASSLLHIQVGAMTPSITTLSIMTFSIIINKT